MKSTFKLASAVLLMASSAAFAAPQAPAPTGAQHPAAVHAAPATKADVKADVKADIKAEQRQITADEKTALAACKTMKGAEKSACRKDAIAKAQSARAHLKAAKHA